MLQVENYYFPLEVITEAEEEEMFNAYNTEQWETNGGDSE